MKSSRVYAYWGYGSSRPSSFLDECSLGTVADGFDFDGFGAEVDFAVLAFAARADRPVTLYGIDAKALAEAGRRWDRPPRLDAATKVKLRAAHDEERSVRAISIAAKLPHSTVARAVRSGDVGPPRYGSPPAVAVEEG
jgi:hypothetical protein